MILLSVILASCNDESVTEYKEPNTGITVRAKEGVSNLSVDWDYEDGITNLEISWD